MNTRCKPTPEPDRQAGFSMIELVFVIAFMGVVLVGLFQVIGASQRGLLNSENRADLTTMSRRVAQNLRVSLSGSQLLFVDPSDSPGLFSGYRNLLTASLLGTPSKAPAMVPWALHPTLPPPSPLIKPDPTWGAYVGNTIAFAAGIKPITVTVASAPGVNSIISLDRFQFVIIYPARFPDQRVAWWNGAARPSSAIPTSATKAGRA
jgi:type II secretory pathway pseudopilin PulG